MSNFIRSVIITTILYVIGWILFFFIPSSSIKNEVDDVKLSIKEIKYYLEKEEPLSSMVPLGIYDLIYPNNDEYKEEISKLKFDIILSSFENSLHRYGNFLFGYIQFIMFIFFIWIYLSFWRFGKKCYRKEIKNEIDKLKDFLIDFADERNDNNMAAFSYSYTIKPNKYLHNYDENSFQHFPEKNIRSHIKSNIIQPIIRDYNKTGKDHALQRVKHIKETFETQHENSSKWLDWALFIIPTIGFIGTVIGISGGLGKTDLIFKEGGAEFAIPIIAADLSLAFDTTLLALIFVAFMFTWKNRLDINFYEHFLERFDKFMFAWITNSNETKNKDI